MKKELLAVIIVIELLQFVVSRFETTSGEILFYFIWIIRVLLWIRLLKPVPNLFVSNHELSDRSQQAKFVALQTQINPHFLYNTLEGIRSEAMIGGVLVAAKMSELLGNFFRYNISNLDQLVTIEDELRNLENYFSIQQFRFEDRIQMETIFEGEIAAIKRCATPKLILQPIVENAIQHGMEPLRRKGTVTLRFQIYEAHLKIIISDNGVGMGAQELEYLNARMEGDEVSETSIGMENVNKRIQLLFGKNFGLRCYSKATHGTDVELTLPVDSGVIQKKLVLQLHNVKTLSGLNRLSFWVGSSEIIGLVIVNQYGIESLLKLLTENGVPKSGKIELNAQASLIDGESRLIEELSIAENLFILNKNFKRSIFNPYEIEIACQNILDEYKLDVKAADSTAALTLVQRIQLELIKAKLSGSKLIILKDIGKLITPSNKNSIQQLIDRLAAKGTAFLFMDSYPDAFFSKCNRILIYEGGTIQKIFYPEQMNSKMLDSYLHKDTFRSPSSSSKSETILTINQYSLSIGQCLLIIDPEKKKLPSLLKLFLQQELLEDWQLQTSISQPYLIPEHPIDYSLYKNQSYIFNLTFGLEKKLHRQVIPNRLLYGSCKEFVVEIGDKHQYETLNHLSQKDLLSLVYYRALLIRPKLVIIYQPFIGIDVKLQTQIMTLIQKLKERQITVVILTSYLAGLENVSEEIIEI